MAITLPDYETQTQLLLNDTSQQEYALNDLDSYINTARGQLAAAAQCVRFTGTLAITPASQSYALTAIVGAPSGAAGALNVYGLACQIANAGNARMYVRPWQWAWYYWLSNPVIATGRPSEWSMQEPGPLGSVYLNLLPDQNYTLDADCAGMVAALTDSDSPPELIPYPLTDAVPYFAAYLALLNSQRMADAEQMLERWSRFAMWGNRDMMAPVMPAYYPGGIGAAEVAAKLLQSGIGGGPARGGR